MDFRKFSAIQFLTSGKKQHRVYYQTADNYIRESSYNDENIWFTSGNGIATKDSKADSPIAVTCRGEKDGETQVILCNLGLRFPSLHSRSEKGILKDSLYLSAHLALLIKHSMLIALAVPINE